MYQNAIYICISWYSKIWWFSVKKWWCQQNSRGVSCDSYIFWMFFRWGVKFHHCRICVTNFRETDLFSPPPHPRESPKKSILNRVNSWQHYDMLMSWNCNSTVLTDITNRFPPFVKKTGKLRKVVRTLKFQLHYNINYVIIYLLQQPTIYLKWPKHISTWMEYEPKFFNHSKTGNRTC